MRIVIQAGGRRKSPCMNHFFILFLSFWSSGGITSLPFSTRCQSFCCTQNSLGSQASTGYLSKVFSHPCRHPLFQLTWSINCSPKDRTLHLQAFALALWSAGNQFYSFIYKILWIPQAWVKILPLSGNFHIPTNQNRLPFPLCSSLLAYHVFLYYPCRLFSFLLLSS